MALVLADRVKETTTTTGTGDLTLGGAEPNFASFSSALSDGDTTYYAIVDDVNADFEIGIGTYTSGTDTLSRDTILDSTNAGSVVNLSAGTKVVFITYPAEKSVRVGGNVSDLTNDAGYLTGITGQSIKNLSDVYSSMSPTDGQVLTYDTTNGWQAETSASPSPDAIPKAWAAVNMSTGLLDSYNVSSGSFSSGDFYLFWDVDMSDTSYAIVTGHQQDNGTTIQFGVLTGSIAVGSARFSAYSNGSSTNLSRCYVAVYDT